MAAFKEAEASVEAYFTGMNLNTNATEAGEDSSLTPDVDGSDVDPLSILEKSAVVDFEAKYVSLPCVFCSLHNRVCSLCTHSIYILLFAGLHFAQRPSGLGAQRTR